MTSPSDKKDLRNPRERECACLVCEYIILTSAPAPKCELCGNWLVIVLNKDGLVKGISRTT